MTVTPESDTTPAVPELIDSEAVVGSFTGFDEIAIAHTFRVDFTELAPSTTMRAIVFVVKRREGMKDGEAFKFVMNARLDAISALFVQPVLAPTEAELAEEEDREKDESSS